MIFGCHAFISENEPSVQNTVSVIVSTNHAGEVHGVTSDATSGAVAPASTVKTSACVTNITSVSRSGRFAANALFSNHKICPIKNSDATNVSHSPRPSDSSRQSNFPRMATPASTNAQQIHTVQPGCRRARTAT